MGEWMNFPNPMMGGSSVLGWFLTILFWVLFIGGIALVVVLIFRSIEKQGEERKKTPMEILDERYAKGEIDEEEYEKKKRKIKD